MPTRVAINGFGRIGRAVLRIAHEREADIRSWFEKYYSIQWNNYPVEDRYLAESEIVPIAD